ncbi:MAG: LacI family DNA-binding transcriptional regulator [Armatimonadota bacterium]|nr:LacI family transcriptional regulator [bacterium]
MTSGNPQKPKRHVTLLQIADVAQVSKATVSMVLNDRPNPFPISEATRKRVMEAAQKLGYRPNAAAKALATGRSLTILMVAFDLWDENLIARLRGVEAHLVPKGYSIRVCTVDAEHGVSFCAELIRSGQADGILLTGLASPQTLPILKTVRDEATTMGLPVVGLANAFPSEYVEATADIDDTRGSQEAVDHLIQHGRRKIALLGVADQPWAHNREQGYRNALAEAGIPVDPELIILGDRSQTWAYDVTLELTRSHEFDAIFAVTDNMAIAAMAALKAAGKRVPEDCAIIGFDNNAHIARFTDPPLTTIENPFYDAGKMAAGMLLNLIDNKPLGAELLPVSLVVRQSCGCKH